MATNDIGVRVKLDGEKQYTEQMRQITQQTKLMRAETTALESGWSKSTSAMEKAAQQTQLLKSQIEQQKTAVATAEANVERYSQATGENSSQTLKWKTALAQAKAELNRLEAELRNVPGSLQIMGQRMQEAGQKIQSVGRGVTTVGTTLTRTVTAPIVAIGAAAVKTTADFDTSMSKVQALSGATGDDFTRLRNKARQMGATTKYSAGESADALSYMALAGWDTNQMIDGLDGVMNLAAASGMDLADASDLVTDYLSAFGLEAKDSARMADQLAYAQAHSNTTTAQLGEAFGNSAAQMHTAGQSMETTTAILEAFANQGLKGSAAGTALSAMVRDLSKHMENGKVQIGNTTVEVMDANGNFRDMTDILADVEAATDGLGSAEKDMALRMVFGDRSIKGVSMALTEGSDKIKGYRNELSNADGTAKAMAETMQDNLAGQITKLKSAMQELGISIGDILVPHIRTAVEWVQKQVDKFNTLDKKTKEQIVRFGLLAAAVGPVVALVGKLVTGVGSMVETVGKAVSAVGKFAGAHEGLMLTLNPVIAGIGLAAAAALALKAGYDHVKESARGANEDLYASIDAVNETSGALTDASDTMRDGFSKADKAIQDVEASSKSATKIADEIEALTKKTSLNRDEQNRLKVLVAEMNQLFPEMGLAIDETGNALNKSSGEIRDFIDNASKMQRAAAYSNALKETLTAMANAELEVAKAEIERDRLQGELATKQGEYDAALASTRKFADSLTGAEKELYMAGSEYNGMVGNQKVALNDAEAALKDQEAALDDCNSALDEAQKESDTYNKALQKIADELGVTVEELLGMEEAADETGDAVEDLAETTEDAADTIEDATEEIIKAYNSAWDSARDSVMGQKSLFEQLEQKEATSIAQMRQGLQSHIEAYRNWNNNASTLMSSARYSTDENFRAIVNTLVTAGQEAAPELQALVDAFVNGDAELDALVQDYGSMSQLANQYSDNMAAATVAAEYGLDGLYKVMYAGAKESVSGFEKPFKNWKQPVKTALSMIDKAKTYLKTSGEKAGASVGESVGAGIKSGKGTVSAGVGALESEAQSGMNKVRGLEGDSKNAGLALADGITSGVRAGRAGISSAFTTIRAAVSTGITQVSNLKSRAKTAGSGVASAVSDGVNSKRGSVTTAGNNITSALRTAINNGVSSVRAAGTSLGNAVGSGIGSASGNARSNANSVANAAKSPLSSIGNSSEPWTWGRHMGDNFANGIGSAYGNVVNQARQLANAVANILRHSTPKEGPLRDDDVWGLHLGQNFAGGITRAIPVVSLAATNMAQSAADAADSYTYSMPMSGASQIGQAVRGLASIGGDEITINVYASEGMNVNELADQVQQRLALLQRQKVRAYA